MPNFGKWRDPEIARKFVSASSSGSGASTMWSLQVRAKDASTGLQLSYDFTVAANGTITSMRNASAGGAEVRPLRQFRRIAPFKSDDEVPWETAPEVLAATKAGDPFTVVRSLNLKSGTVYVAKQPIYISANDTKLSGGGATIRASADFDANCQRLKIEDVEKGILMVAVVRDAKLCVNNIHVADIELDGRTGSSLGRVGNLRQASVGIYARSDSSADTSGPAANHSGVCGSNFTMERVRCHDVNVQCIGISDWTNITLKDSSLAHIGNAEYRGFGSDTLANLSLKCGGQRWAWYCGYMHTLYYTRTNNALIQNTSFDDAMFGSALDLTGAFNTKIVDCSFSNIRQSVVYHANGGYARQADNTSIEDSTAVNCSSIATIGSPHLTITNLAASAVRFGFYLHGGADAEVSDSTFELGGETPSAADTDIPAALVLADGGEELTLSGVRVSYDADAHGASLVVLDTQSGDAPSSGDAVSAIEISNATVSASGSMDFILDCVSAECGGLAQNGVEVSGSTLPPVKSNVNWKNASKLLKLDKLATDDDAAAPPKPWVNSTDGIHLFLTFDYELNQSQIKQVGKRYDYVSAAAPLASLPHPNAAAACARPARPAASSAPTRNPSRCPPPTTSSCTGLGLLAVDDQAGPDLLLAPGKP